MNAIYQTQRGRDLFPNPSKTARSLASRVTQEFRTMFDFSRPANLRFTCTFDFDEDMAREGLPMYYDEKDVERIVELARELHEAGI